MLSLLCCLQWVLWSRLMGDAVRDFVGAPIAPEDNPLRACLAALDIVPDAKEYAVIGRVTVQRQE